jgi:2-amino-4-hydroxy-6-hydroxymethyldihydropteridine diphosphokinase
LGLGSNVGDRVKHINSAVDELRQDRDLHVIRVSPLYETSPQGGPPQGDFVNGAVLVLTSLPAEELLRRTLAVEAKLGRVRSGKNEPRTIDLDLLWIEGESIDEADLVVPHPRLKERSFALRPLVDLASDARDEAGQAYADLDLAKAELKLAG